MARLILKLTILIFAVFRCATPANAAVTVQLPYLDAPRAEHIESLLLKVRGLPAGFRGKSICIQDARGGIRFGRSIEGWSGGSSAPERTVMLPLPLVAAADLPQDRWPVIITLVDADGVEQREFADVPLPPGGPAGPARRVLLVTGSGDTDESAVPATLEANSSAAGEPAAITRMSEADFQDTPALALAGFDVVKINAHAGSLLSQERLAALLNAGLRVIVQQADAPTGSLGAFIWDRMPGDPPEMSRWITPREPLARPFVIEPALMQARPLQVQAEMSAGLRRLLLSVAPVGIVIVVLARMMIRRSAMLLGTITAALIVWTGVAIACAAAQSSPEIVSAAWVTRYAPPMGSADSEGGSALALRESFTASAALIARDLVLSARPGELLWPVAAYPHQYFALQGADILLDHPEGGRSTELLTMHVPARFGVVIARRSVTPAPLLSMPPQNADEVGPWALRAGMDVTQAWRLDAGYVTPAAGPGGSPQLFQQWIKDTARADGMGNDAECWYALRFDGHRRYVVVRQAGGGAARPELLILDSGPVPPGRDAATAPGSGTGS